MHDANHVQCHVCFVEAFISFGVFVQCCVFCFGSACLPARLARYFALYCAARHYVLSMLHVT